MSVALTVKVDAKGRLTIPGRLRAELNIKPGDTLFVDRDDQQGLRYMKAPNPFDVLAEHALEERQAGRTRGLRAFAAEHNIALDAN